METRKYAALVFAIPLDKEFHYSVPSILRNEIAVGTRVKVQFGPRVTDGFVVGFVDQPQVSRVLPIQEVIDSQPLITDEILKLTRWMADYYRSSWGEALNMALPGGVKRYTSSRTEQFASLALPDDRELEEVIDEVGKRSSKGAQVLRVLSESDKAIRVMDLRNTLKITASPLKTLEKKGYVDLEDRPVALDPYENMEVEPHREIEFTEGQSRALDYIFSKVEGREFGVVLLHGVTGSGKTEVYLESIEKVVQRGQGAIVLIPEISLTPQTVKRFKSRFGDIVAFLHSGLTDGQRSYQWNRIRSGEARVVIGPRSAIFAPLSDLGLVVVDEEHENSFKESSSPRYNGRDVAIMRSHMENAVVILGTATPSLESYYNAQTEKYKLIELGERATPHPLPQVEVVDMREEYQERRGMVLISRRLKFLVDETLEQKNQVILFLNRRGFSTFISCQRCGYILKCEYCDITLTFHKGHHRTICHYCGFDCKPPDKCPDCLADTIRYLGTGTEKIEEVLSWEFPDAKIARLDGDTMHRGGGYIDILDQFRKRELDILLGTQIIAKGLDFPGVTLVGVISADVGLHLPDFHAAERTFQLMTQVAGRAGRGIDPGRVVIQTMLPDHYSVVSAAHQDFDSFAKTELDFRRQFGYPPFRRLIRLVIQGKDLREVSQHAHKVKGFFPDEMPGTILGPAPCPIAQIKGEHRFQIMGKFAHSQEVRKILAHLPENMSIPRVKVTLDVDPVAML